MGPDSRPPQDHCTIALHNRLPRGLNELGTERRVPGPAQLTAIVQSLPKKRQTMLYSATLTKNVKALARISLARDAEVIGGIGSAGRRKAAAAAAAAGSGSDDDEEAEGSSYEMPNKLAHMYMDCEQQDKINVLFSFARSHTKCRILVFMSSCKQVKFFHEMIRRGRPGLPVMCLHGRMKQMKRMAAFCKFCDSDSSIMLATDVAARGLDFPSLDWVVHVDCPEDVATYIHRSGRTARCDTAFALCFHCLCG